MSTHAATVVKVKMEPHPDAEALSIMKLDSGNVVVLRTADWTEGELAVHVEPDYEVNVEHKAFSWLAVEKDGKPRSKWERVKPAKLRGVKSYGFLVPLKEVFSGYPAWMANIEAEIINPGDNVYIPMQDELKVIRRWEPPIDMKYAGDTTSAPANIIAPKYDVENYYKYAQHFVEGEEVVATEKLHGSNGRYVWDGEQFHCGSRTQWKTEAEGDPRWRALNSTPGLKDFLRANQGVVVYGEVYGNNPGFRYGVERGDQVRFAIFDLLLQTSIGPQWADWDVIEETKRKFRVPFTPDVLWVPVIYKGPYNLELMKSLAVGDTTMPGVDPRHIREGIVVKPVKERTFGGNSQRLQVKFVSDDYLEKS